MALVATGGRTALPRRLGLSALALVAAVGLAQPAEATLPEFAGQQMPSLAPLLHEVTPAVVNIAVTGRVRENNPLYQDPFFRQFFNMPQQIEREEQATGSGVIVDAQRGYVLTNNHLVEHAGRIEVTTKDKRRFTARVLGRDPDTDIAVLQLEGASGLTALPFGNSEQLQVGDFVLAIGNPFGLGQTVTSGIVSALGRSGLGIEGYEDFIQTDASINPGNSGGALVDLHGQLIGINTAILSPGGSSAGIGFAIPINMARRAMDQIERYGEVRRGRLGISIQDLTPALAQAMHTNLREGVVVAGVDPNSPAARAGLQPKDIIVAADGRPIATASDLHNLIGFAPVNSDIRLTLERGGRQLTAAVRVAPATTRTADRVQQPE
jgi:serine protease Do